MILQRLGFLFALALGLAWAQSDPQIDIRGVVTELGFNIGLAGAEVTLFEFVGPSRVRTAYGTAATDKDGEFHFHPVRFGDYYVEVKKPGYFATIPMSGPNPRGPLAESTGTLVSVSSGHPSLTVGLTLMRPGEISGTVIGEDDKPLAGVVVDIASAGSPILSTGTAHTDKDGLFTVSKLV